MASSFRFNSNAAPSNAAQGNNDAWKAQGFVNLYLPGAEGKAKFGAIPLRMSNADEKELLEFAKRDPVAFAQWLAANITFDFREVREGGGRFAIPK